MIEDGRIVGRMIGWVSQERLRDQVMFWMLLRRWYSAHYER
jgi:hypothetical protein